MSDRLPGASGASGKPRIKMRLVDKVDYKGFAGRALKAADKALYDLARYIHSAAKWSIKGKSAREGKPKKPAAAGTPYFSWRDSSMRMKDSLIVEREDGKAVIGYFRGHRVADTHEFGGLNPLNKNLYPARPVLGPALNLGMQDFSRDFPKAYGKYFRHKHVN